MKAMTIQAFIFFIEFKFTLDDASKQLSLDDIAKNSWEIDDTTRNFETLRLTGDAEAAKKNVVLEKYDLERVISCVVSVKQWNSILQTGVIDRERFNEDLAGAKEVAGIESWPSWQKLWHWIDWDFFSDGAETMFWASIKDLLTKIECGCYAEPGEFLHAAGIIRSLTIHGLIEKTPADYENELKSSIDQHLIPNFTLKRWDSLKKIDIRSNGLGYSEVSDCLFKNIRDHLNTSAAKWYESWKKDHATDFLLDLLSDDLYDFVGELTVENDVGYQRFCQEPILHHVKVKEFIAKWFLLRPANQRFLIGRIKNRYSNHLQALKPERDWWVKVSKNLNVRQQDEHVRPRAVQIGILKQLVDDNIIAKIDNLLEKEGND